MQGATPTRQRQDRSSGCSLFDPRARFLIGGWLAWPDDSRDAVFEWDPDALEEGRALWRKDGSRERELEGRGPPGAGRDRDPH
jgi:hypothetical protein